MFGDEVKHGNRQVVNQTIDNILKEFGDHALTKSHARHIALQECKDMGLKIEMMEDNQDLQEAVLTLHHITMRTLTDTPAVKIVENHILATIVYYDYNNQRCCQYYYYSSSAFNLLTKSL